MELQQDFFNPASHSPEILIIRHARRVVPRLDVSLFTTKDALSLKKVSKNACTLTTVVSSDGLSPTPLTSSAMKTPENTEGETDDPEPADEEDNHMEYSSG
jgi:hypothetical protein